MTDQTDSQGKTRRSLFRTAGLGAGAAVAAVAEAAAGAPSPAPETARGELYRESEHVRRYYALAAY